jgi:DNA anti-recombination protein RmuC
MGTENPLTTPMSIQIRSNRDVTSSQISDLLGAISHLTSCLRIASQEAETFGADKEDRARTVDGGARLALEVSLAKACNRLDTLLDEATRWTEPLTDSRTMSLTYLGNQICLQRQLIAEGESRLGTMQQRLRMETESLRDRLNMETAELKKRLEEQTLVVSKTLKAALKRDLQSMRTETPE